MSATSVRPVELADFVATIDVAAASGRIAAGSLAGDSVILEPSGDLVSRLPEHPFGVLCVAWSPNGRLLASGGQDGVIRVHDADGTTLATHATRAPGDSTRWVAALAWSPNGRHLAAAAGRRLLLLDQEGNRLHHYPDAASTITDVRWSIDGTRLGCTAYGGVTWFDVDRLPVDKPARFHSFAGSPLSLALSPTGKWACAGYQDASIHLWRLWSGDELSMSGYPAKVEHVAFRADGEWMASTCLDELTVWRFAGAGPRGTRPTTGRAHDRHIAALAWEPGGDRLVTGGADGRLVIWPSPGRRGGDLTPLHVQDGDVAVSALAWIPGGPVVVGRADGGIDLHRVT